MLQLLTPIGLLAAAAVLIPILVHLWQVQKGKTLRVGSIALLAHSARTSIRSWRIHHWPLFLLRCLLVLLLAFLLATPLWQQPPAAKKAQGWLLIPHAQLSAAYTQYPSLIDSLLLAGWEVHDLNTGFPVLSLHDLASYPAQPVDGTDSLRPWALLTTLDALLPAAYPVHVFVGNRLQQYSGSRPQTHLALRWHTLAAGDSSVRAPAIGWVTPQNAIRQLDHVSTPAGNYYEASRQPSLLPGQVDTAVLRITLYAGNASEDARYLKAALYAITEIHERSLDLQLLNRQQVPASPQDIIFMLDTIPGHSLVGYLRPGGSLFQYDTGPVQSISSWPTGITHAHYLAYLQRIHQYAAGPAKGWPVWTLANGQALLTVADTAGRRLYSYKGRFNPAWNDAVWSAGFVKTLLPMVLRQPVPPAITDVRLADERQLIPTSDSTRRRAVATAGQHVTATSLTTLLGLVSLIVFGMERWLAFRLQRQTNG